VKKCLAKGADPNTKDFCGYTLLHEAAINGHSEVVKVLLEHRAEMIELLREHDAQELVGGTWSTGGRASE